MCTSGGAVVITTAQLHPTKPELRFCAGSSSNWVVSMFCNGKNFDSDPAENMASGPL